MRMRIDAFAQFDIDNRCWYETAEVRCPKYTREDASLFFSPGHSRSSAHHSCPAPLAASLHPCWGRPSLTHRPHRAARHTLNMESVQMVGAGRAFGTEPPVLPVIRFVGSFVVCPLTNLDEQQQRRASVYSRGHNKRAPTSSGGINPRSLEQLLSTRATSSHSARCLKESPKQGRTAAPWKPKAGGEGLARRHLSGLLMLMRGCKRSLFLSI